MIIDHVPWVSMQGRQMLQIKATARTKKTKTLSRQRKNGVARRGAAAGLHEGPSAKGSQVWPRVSVCMCTYEYTRVCAQMSKRVYAHV